MERDIKPCISKAGKWKRAARLKKLAQPYSNSTRRFVPRAFQNPHPTVLETTTPLQQPDVSLVVANFVNDEPNVANEFGLTSQNSSPEINVLIECTPECSGPGDNMVSSAEHTADEDTTNEIYGMAAWAAEKSDQKLPSLESLRLKVLTFASKYKIPNYGINELLRLLKTSNPHEVTKLPLTLCELESSVLPEWAKFLVSWTCRADKCGKTLLVSTSPQNPSPQAQICCGISYTTNDNHSVYLQMRELLRIVLPRIWPLRDLSRLPKSILNKMKSLGLDERRDISITANVDGAPASKSSNCSIWPILSYIDGLPKHVTMNNILLVGVYVSHDSLCSKPDMNKFLTPFVATMNSLLTAGVTWNPDSTTEVTSKVFVSKILCDSMARPSVQNMQQLNGKFGCGFCFHRETKHYFQHTPMLDLRSNANHRSLCNTFEFTGTIDVEKTRGILGRSVLLDLDYVNIINDAPPCYMHTLYLGITRTFTQFLLTDTSCAGRLNKEQLQELTDNLLLIKPPHRVSRTPRSLGEMTHWKAHEWGMWLMYYSPVLLYHTAPRAYWCHWIHLVFGCSILLTSSHLCDQIVIDERLKYASESLEKFSADVLQLYGPRACRFNVHLLRHLPALAKYWGGDILSLTMAPFESFNAVLQSFINNSQYMGYQVARRYWTYLQTHGAVKSTGNESVQRQFGLLSDYHPQDGVLIPSLNDNVRYYSHVKSCDGKSWYSVRYSRSKLRDSSWVNLKDGRYAEVDVFGESDTGVWAIVRIFTTSPFAGLTHIVKIIGVSMVDVVKLQELDTEIIKVEFKTHRYACKFLNNWEHIRE